MVYYLALFLHVLGAMGIFIALGLEWVALPRLRTVTDGARARDWMGVLGAMQRVAILSMLTLLVTGIYMAITRWGGQPFVIGGLVGIVLLGALGGAVTGRRLQRVEPKLRAAPGQIPAETRRALGDRALDMSLRARTTLAIGIVYLMTVKPGVAGTIVALILAVAIGVAVPIPARRASVAGEA